VGDIRKSAAELLDLVSDLLDQSPGPAVRLTTQLHPVLHQALPIPTN
jgi:hypothetical protein